MDSAFRRRHTAFEQNSFQSSSSSLPGCSCESKKFLWRDDVVGRRTVSLAVTITAKPLLWNNRASMEHRRLFPRL
eukprot:3224177-Pyramimonas_sp.AAC.1